MIITVPEFASYGACRDVDPDLHFPAGETGRAALRQITEAKQVCATCPVIERCREFGMTQPYGVWGGLSERERREMRAAEARRRNLAAIDGDAEKITWPVARPTTREAQRLFAQVLAELESSGANVVALSDIPRLFLTRVRSRSWVYTELSRLADLGVLAETERQGVYRFVVPVTGAVAA